MSQLVQNYIIYGKPVNSSNTKRAAINYATGKPYIHPSKELKAWFADAADQLAKQIGTSGHDVEREIVTTRKLKWVKRKGQRVQELVDKQAIKFRNPIFQRKYFPDGYQLVVYFFHAEQMAKRDETTREIIFRKDGVTPAAQHYEPDLDGVIKGASDALERAGALDNDRYVKEHHLFDMATLPFNAAPFLCVMLQERGAPIPLPILPVELGVHMPRVFDSQSGWVEERTQERAFAEWQRKGGIELPPPQSKIRCARCHIWIGLGHVEQEIWMHYGASRWNEERWTNEVVLICGHCAATRFKHEDTKAIANVESKTLLAVNTLYNMNLTKIPEDTGTIEYGKYLNTRALVYEQLWLKYRSLFCLVTADKIGDIDWYSTIADRLGIEQLREKAQQEVFPHVRHKHKRSSSRPAQTPAGIANALWSAHSALLEEDAPDGDECERGSFGGVAEGRAERRREEDEEGDDHVSYRPAARARRLCA